MANKYLSANERFSKNTIFKGRCWNWVGYKNPKGYGVFSVNGKLMLAHRFSYLREHGKIPKGFSICHKCHNPSCVKPSHLYAGTHSQNMQDCVRAGRFGIKKQAFCGKGHRMIGRNVAKMPTYRACRTCKRRWNREWKENIRRKKGIPKRVFK